MFLIRLLFTSILLLFLQMGISQVTHNFTPLELEKFYSIHISSKSISSLITPEEFIAIQKNIKISDDEIKSLLASDQNLRNISPDSKAEQFVKNLKVLSERKRISKEEEIKKLCQEKELKYELYLAILERYNSDSEFQNVVCQNI